eukprot:CAMPEP_0173058738 /NCGR_PEP_ID=MMETSP1102-20130122/1536_1 /TAXON_ID=49646 /ORGANISM="Geminigera sp., Strain Caron Lab Isolate" /LENGTH=70 /DNA_ID=CAMNT_0013924545 /DNA_START=149 /DNA_END=361 /DNA_ORIENTATION=-
MTALKKDARRNQEDQDPKASVAGNRLAPPMGRNREPRMTLSMTGGIDLTTSTETRRPKKQQGATSMGRCH